MSSDEHDDPKSSPMDDAATYAALRKLDLSGRPLAITFHELAELTQRAIGEASYVSVTVLGQRGPHTAAFTGDVALRLDGRQYETGHGPCLDAAVSMSAVHVVVDDAAAPYPDFRRSAAAEGVTHSLSVGIPATGLIVGGLNLYGSSGPFSAQSARMIRIFAGIAGLAYAAKVGEGEAPSVVQLEQALATREVVNQAQGVLMARLACSRAEAFLTLARLADEQGITVHQAAQTLVDGGS